MKFTSILLSGCVLLSGCATNVNSVTRAQPEATTRYVSDKRIITDATLAAIVRIVSVNEAVVSGNLRKIQVTLENAKDNTRVVSYRFEWTDRNGMAASLPESWQRLAFAGRETLTVSSVARSPESVDFNLKLIEGGN
jgi:uncharacterized protein YcfL